MEKILADFADLAASVLAERWQKMQTGVQAGSQPGSRLGQAVEGASVRVTVVDGQTETTAHATIRTARTPTELR